MSNASHASETLPNDQWSSRSLEQTLQASRSGYTVEQSRMMRAEGFDWEHEIRVALPPGYDHTTTTYPTLWIMDNQLELALSLFGANEGGKELILVSVGAEKTISFAEWERRRTFDFCPDPDDYLDSGPRGDHIRNTLPDVWPGVEIISGGAPRFLDFLIDDVRVALESEYRMNPDEDGIIGESGGGTSSPTHYLAGRPVSPATSAGAPHCTPGPTRSSSSRSAMPLNTMTFLLACTSPLARKKPCSHSSTRGDASARWPRWPKDSASEAIPRCNSRQRSCLVAGTA